MLAIKDAVAIAELFYYIDQGVRYDLFNKGVADERDYVSRLVTHFTHPFGIFTKYTLNQFQFKSKWFARVNSGHHERKFGCDSMIVFEVDGKVKVGLFEAKWPRVIFDPAYVWDYIPKGKKLSHFTDQIERQSNWMKQAAIWEMFFYEGQPGITAAPFDPRGSTCIKHQVAQVYITGANRPAYIWDNDDLDRLIRLAQSSAYTSNILTNLFTIIVELLSCQIGEAITIRPGDTSFTLQSNDGEGARCPIPNLEESESSDQLINGFMEQCGLSSFQYMKIIPKNPILIEDIEKEARQ
ncbi:hypothetical protein D3C87_298980 [compost metagenome]